MRTLLLLMACCLLCSCGSSPADARARQERRDHERRDTDQEDIDLFKVADAVLARSGTQGYDKLSRPEQVLVCIWILEGEVNNGGFHQYYLNGSGDYARDAAAALDAVDARNMSNLVRQANALFGESGPSPAHAERQKELNALSGSDLARLNELDEAFFKSPDDVDALLERYVSRHPEAFGLR